MSGKIPQPQAAEPRLLRAALSLASRTYVIDSGHIVFEGTAEALQASPEPNAKLKQ